MDINARATAICTELGKLDHEIRMREKRRDMLRAELEVLDGLALQIQRAAQLQKFQEQRPAPPARPLPDIPEPPRPPRCHFECCNEPCTCGHCNAPPSGEGGSDAATTPPAPGDAGADRAATTRPE